MRQYPRGMARPVQELAVQVGDRLRTRGRTLATAESCTGGWIAKVITDVPGSSGWFERGFVTYSNAAKVDMLGVSEVTLATYGAVSAETVREMAEGALAHSQAEVAVAVSGIAGPDGGSPDKPVGTVWLAWSSRGGATRSHCYRFSGDREAVRYQSVLAALEGLMDGLNR